MKQVIYYGLVFCCAAFSAAAATGRVIKVLPHFLDQQGRHTVSPSLFDRDAYQAVLRQHPEQRSGMRFDIEWRVKGTPDSDLKLRLEARGSARGSVARTVVFETHVEPKGWFGQWTGLTLTGEDYKNLGELTAWRATLWDGDHLLSEQQSFLW